MEPKVSYVVLGDDLIWREVEGEVVVVHAPSSAYFGVNLSGTVLWTQLAAAATTVDQLATLLEQHFGRDSDRAGEDAAAFVDQAVREGLIVVTGNDGPSGLQPRPESAAASTQSYEPPTVVRFGDLETLVLSGE
jgi:hypothetical protein